MESQLKDRLHALKAALTQTEGVGLIGEPAKRANFPEDIPASYQNFLREADGAACGAITLYESNDILGRQGPAKALRGGRKAWFCIASIEDDLFVLNTADNTVHYLSMEDSLRPGDSLGELDYFLLTVVLGDDYAEFVSDINDDPWYALIHSPRPI